MSREREDTGRYTETVTLDDVLGVFWTVDGPVVTSGNVADALDCSRETARRKLRALKERGRIASRKTAGMIVWWLVDEGESARGVDPDDPFWEFGPGASGEADVSENVDEKFHVVQYDDRIELVPVEDDPLTAVRDAAGDAFEGAAVEELRAESLDVTEQEANE